MGQRFTLADVAAGIPLYHFQQQAERRPLICVGCPNVSYKQSMCHTGGPGEVTWTCHQTLAGNLLGDRGQGL